MTSLILHAQLAEFVHAGFELTAAGVFVKAGHHDADAQIGAVNEVGTMSTAMDVFLRCLGANRRPGGELRKVRQGIPPHRTLHFSAFAGRFAR